MKTIEKKIPCPSCHGTGQRKDPFIHKTVACGKCNGKGFQISFSHYERDDNCPQSCGACIYAEKCADVAVFMGKWDDMSQTQKDNFIQASHANSELASLAVLRIMHNRSDIRISLNTGAPTFIPDLSERKTSELSLDEKKILISLAMTTALRRGLL